VETHAKVLGILNVVFGALGLLGAVALVIIFGGVAGLITAEGDREAAVAASIVGVTGASIVIFTILTSLPAIVIGLGLYRLRPWSRIWAIALSIVSLIAFPFGTALGLYGLWVLFSADGQKLFAGVSGIPATQE
jgi:hypothetical protein